MPLTQLTLDLGSLLTFSKYLIAFVLLAISTFVFLLPWLRELWPRPVATGVRPTPLAKPKRRDVDRSSDTPPPPGFAEHLRIIEATAPNAEPKIWWEYAKSEMTEAEVAIAEARLARIADPAIISGSLGGDA